MMVLLRGKNPRLRIVSGERSGDWVLEIVGAVVEPRVAQYEEMPGTIVKGVRVSQWRHEIVRITVIRKESGQIGYSFVNLGSGSFVVALTPSGDAPLAVGNVPAGKSSAPTSGEHSAAFIRRRTRLDVQLAPAEDRIELTPAAYRAHGVDSIDRPGTAPGRRWVTRATSRVIQDLGGSSPLASPALGLQAAYSDEGSPLGFLSCHVRQEARFNDGLRADRTVLTGLAAVQPVLPFLSTFQGAQIQSNRPEGANADLRSRMYGGLGVLRPATTSGLWYSLISVDRVANENWASSYYSQSFRLGLKQRLAGAVDLGVQGSVERIDPMVRSTAFFRAVGELDLRLVQESFEVGTRLVLVYPQLGNFQQRNAILAPYFESSF